MFIKSEPFLHQKSAKWALNMVLMLLTKFLNSSQIATLEGAFFFNCDDKFTPNIAQICPKKHQKSTFSAPLQKISASKVRYRWWH